MTINFIMVRIYTLGIVFEMISNFRFATAKICDRLTNCVLIIELCKLLYTKNEKKTIYINQHRS
jgi:hypothetical protein